MEKHRIIICNEKLAKKAKGIFLIGCITGFLYQYAEFVKLFMSHPVNEIVETKDYEYILMPAFTVCENYAFPRLAYCNMYREKCQVVSNRKEFCRKYHLYCEYMEISGMRYRTALLFPKEESMEHFMNQSFLRKTVMLHSPMTFQQKLFGKIDEISSTYTNCPQTRIVIKDTSQRRRVCFRLGSSLEASHLSAWNLNLRQSFIHKDDAMMFVMKHNIINYSLPFKNVEMAMALHSPFEFVNPLEDGFIVRPGKNYYLLIKVVILELLESPYRTDCTDYHKLWTRNNHSGPLSQQVCATQCYMKQTLAHCECVPDNIIYPHDEEECGPEKTECLEEVDASVCRKNCKKECKKVEFYYKASSMFNLPIYWKTLHYASFTSSDVILNFQERDVVHIKVVPKFEDIELFGYLGGYVGIWLGLSILSFVQIFETVGERLLTLLKGCRL